MGEPEIFGVIPEAPGAAAKAGAGNNDPGSHQFLIRIRTGCSTEATSRIVEKAARFLNIRLTLRRPDRTTGGLEFGAGQQTVFEETIDGYRIQVQAYDHPPPPGIDPGHASTEPEQLVVDGFGVANTDLPWIASRDPVTLAYRRLVTKVTATGESAKRVMPSPPRIDTAVGEFQRLQAKVETVLYRGAAAVNSKGSTLVLPGGEYPAAERLGVTIPPALETLPSWQYAIDFGAPAKVRRSKAKVMAMEAGGSNPAKAPEDRAERITLAYALAKAGIEGPVPVEDDPDLLHANGNPLWSDVPKFVRMHPTKPDEGSWPDPREREGTDNLRGPRVAGMQLEVWTKTGENAPEMTTVKATVILPSIPSEEYPEGVIYDPADAVRLAILPAETDGPDPAVLAQLAMAAYGPADSAAATTAWLKRATVAAARRLERERSTVYPTLRTIEDEARSQLAELAPENQITTITIDKRVSELQPGDGIALISSRTRNKW